MSPPPPSVESENSHIHNHDHGSTPDLDSNNGSAAPAVPAPLKPKNWVPVLEQAINTPRKIRMVIVGAGFSGLILAHKIQNELKLEDFIDYRIYEKNSDLGGTWFENRYPGAACDVPAHIYTFSWEPNPDWTSFYAGSSEIWDYMKRTSDKYNLAKNVSFNSKIVESIWNDSKAKWEVKVVQRAGDDDDDDVVITDECDVFVDASGILNKWDWPKIPGLHDFKGHLMHSANWDDKIDLSNKRIAVIGNGASAIQLVPQLQKVASHLSNFVRSPTWIAGNMLAETYSPDGRNNFKYTDQERHNFRTDPTSLKSYRKTMEHRLNHLFHYSLQKTPTRTSATESCKSLMLERLSGGGGGGGNLDPEQASKFIPDWEFGCRRITPGDGYLEAFREKNVSLVTSPIVKVTTKGIVTAGGGEGEEGEEELEVDAIVCGTGFDVSFIPRWKLRGKDGVELSKLWNVHAPEAYLSVLAPYMPNYFIMSGPGFPAAHGSLLAVLEWTADYVLKWVRKLACEDIKSTTIKPTVITDYNTYSQELLKRTLWTSSGCSSWYKDPKTGKVTALYSGSLLHYKELLENIRGEDFDIEYWSGNRFRFMGNGFTRREEEGGDLGFYVYK